MAWWLCLELFWITFANHQLNWQKLKRKKIHVQISGISPCSAAISKSKVWLPFVSCLEHSPQFTATGALVFSSLTAYRANQSACPIAWPHLWNIQLAVSQYYRPSKIDVILGAHVYLSLLLDGIPAGLTGSPIGKISIACISILREVRPHETCIVQYFI